MGGIFILTLPIPIVVNSFASYYKNRLWRNEVAYKKRQRAKKRKEMELLMRDNLLNILTVPGEYFKKQIYSQRGTHQRTMHNYLRRNIFLRVPFDRVLYYSDIYLGIFI